MRRPRGQDVPRAGAAAAVRGADHPSQTDEGRELGPAPEELARLERLAHHQGAGIFTAGLEAGILSSAQGLKPRDLPKLINFEAASRGRVRVLVALPNFPGGPLDVTLSRARLLEVRGMFAELGKKLRRAMASKPRRRRRPK